MKKQDAIAFQEHIEQECRKKGVWVEVRRENRPKLGKIVIIVNIKIDE